MLINILSLLTEGGLDKTTSTVESCRIIPGNSSLTDTVSGKLLVNEELDTRNDITGTQETNKDQVGTKVYLKMNIKKEQK